MSISYSGVTLQNWEKSSFWVEVNEKKDTGPILVELKGARECRFSPKGEMVYFATRVDSVLLIWLSSDRILL